MLKSGLVEYHHGRGRVGVNSVMLGTLQTYTVEITPRYQRLNVSVCVAGGRSGCILGSLQIIAGNEI